MIFVTVGHQMPFDRLVRTVDEWACASGRVDVFAQIGQAAYVPQSMKWKRTLDSEEYRQRLQEADVVVAHAGMGTILTALELGTPILMMPRRGDLRETRNDHQFATSRRLRDRAGIHLAIDECELRARLDGLAGLQRPGPIPDSASDELLGAIRGFVSLT